LIIRDPGPDFQRVIRTALGYTAPWQPAKSPFLEAAALAG